MSRPLPGALARLAVPLAWAYGRAIAMRNRRYDRGTATTVKCPVISAGNLTTGGVGKTPFVRWLATMLVARDHHPAIAMRGYGARPGAPSDEQAEYEDRLPNVPLVVDPDRGAALARFLPAHPEIDCVLLDDGFQHRRLGRDLDLVLVDASRPCLDDRLLPAGSLREPAVNLRRADAVVVTRASSVDPDLASVIARLHGAPPLAWSRHVWTGLCVNDRKSRRVVDVDWLDGKRALPLLGIGNAAAVRAQIEATGAITLPGIAARDHERYTPAKLARVRRAAADADVVIMTGKDWVKVRRLIDLSIWPVPVVVPDLEIEVFAGEAALIERVLAAVRTS